MTTGSDLESALVPVVECLERLGASYCIGGSVASSALGMPRSTLDVDLVTDLAAPQVKAFVGALEADYYIEEGAIRDAIRTSTAGLRSAGTIPASTRRAAARTAGTRSWAARRSSSTASRRIA